MYSGLNRAAWLLGGLSLGLGLMYMFDPERGRTRRALLRDKAGSLVLHTNTSLAKQVRNLGNRTRGVIAVTRSRMQRSGVTDEQLAARVRGEVERLAPDPGSLHVSIHDGRVVVSGPILAGRVQGLIEQIAMIPGVRGVQNRLSIYQNPGDMPGSAPS